MTLRLVPECYVDRKEMSRILGISLSTLDKMVAADQIPSCTWGRRSRRFLPSEVLDALKRMDVAA